MKNSSLQRWSVLLAGATACGSGESGGTAGNTVAGSDRGIATSDEVGAVIKEAFALGESAWPGARLSGVRVGPQAVELARTGSRVRLANVYSVRVSFAFEVDPADATAKSGSVVCAPTCRVERAKVKSAPAAPWPCGFEEALAAARKAGVRAERPLVGYGKWAADFKTGQQWSGWMFRADETSPVVEIGAGCQVTR
jgi:hypothetical protein